VACISGKEEVEGIIERVPGMKDEQEKIDLLLARNANEQLKNVDWNKLNVAISHRLDKVRQSKTSTKRFPTVFKIVAEISAVAVVVVIAVMIKLEKPTNLQLDEGRTAMVEFVKRKGLATVALIEPSDRAHVKVYIAGKDKKLAQCYVKMIDSDRSRKEDSTQAAWIIISRSERVYADNGTKRDMMDMLCLF